MPEVTLHETERFALLSSTCGDPLFSPSLVIRWENGVRVDIPVSEIAYCESPCRCPAVHSVYPCEGIRICYQYQRVEPDIEEGSAEETTIYATLVDFWIAEFTPGVCSIGIPDDLIHWKIKLSGNNLSHWTWERTEVDADGNSIGKPRVIPESEARRLEQMYERVVSIIEQQQT